MAARSAAGSSRSARTADEGGAGRAAQSRARASSRGSRSGWSQLMAMGEGYRHGLYSGLSAPHLGALPGVVPPVHGEAHHVEGREAVEGVLHGARGDLGLEHGGDDVAAIGGHGARPAEHGTREL